MRFLGGAPIWGVGHISREQPSYPTNLPQHGANQHQAKQRKLNALRTLIPLRPPRVVSPPSRALSAKQPSARATAVSGNQLASSRTISSYLQHWHTHRLLARTTPLHGSHLLISATPFRPVWTAATARGSSSDSFPTTSKAAPAAAGAALRGIFFGSGLQIRHRHEPKYSPGKTGFQHQKWGLPR